LEQTDEVRVKADFYFMSQTWFAYVVDSKCGSDTGNGLAAIFPWIVRFRSICNVRCPFIPPEKENDNAVKKDGYR
jgi:hypothetical protein